MWVNYGSTNRRPEVSNLAMKSKEETGKIAGGNMDEEGSKGEEVKGSPHASTQNNTAVGYCRQW